MNAIVTTDRAALLQIVPNNAQGDVKSRLALYDAWRAVHGLPVELPDLAAYRDYLLTEYTGRDGKPLAPSSVKAHLSTIRGRYAALLDDNDTRAALYARTPAEATPADRKAFVDESLKRLENAVKPKAARVKVTTVQDKADSEIGRRLTKQQANTLLEAPGADTLIGLRDTAMLALMLCTGIREAELVALDVRDLRQTYKGALALRVKHGKGAKQRMIPYGALDFCLAIVDAWRAAAGIDTGPVFRGFYKGGKRVRPGRLTVRAVNQVMERYTVSVDGQIVTVKPHDLRRTYARLLWDSGMDILSIQQNLGHASSRTTEKYIGTQSADRRKPGALLSFDLRKLRRLV